MSLFKEWEDLTKNQTEDSFPDFWKEYSEGETTIYSYILDHYTEPYEGKLEDLAKKHGVSNVIYMGFLDGIQESIKNDIALDALTEDSDISLDIDFEKLFFNMNKADAEYLFTLPQWSNVLGDDKLEEITKSYKKSKTVVKGEKIGRNDPCPCGSGKKYKHCCMNKGA